MRPQKLRSEAHCSRETRDRWAFSETLWIELSFILMDATLSERVMTLQEWAKKGEVTLNVLKNLVFLSTPARAVR